jgi:hypothetical protein
MESSLIENGNKVHEERLKLMLILCLVTKLLVYTAV